MVSILPAYKWGQVFILSSKYTPSYKPWTEMVKQNTTKQNKTGKHAQYAFVFDNGCL